jgi:hypothetical protein
MTATLEPAITVDYDHIMEFEGPFEYTVGDALPSPFLTPGGVRYYFSGVAVVMAIERSHSRPLPVRTTVYVKEHPIIA